MASKFRQLFDQNVMRAMDRQKSILEIHPQQQWEFDKPNSRLDLLESNVSFHVQILGMEDLVKGVWRWSWADDISGFASHGMVAAKKMQLLGQKYDIAEFTEGEIPLDQVNAQDIAIVASGILGASCYWAVGSADEFSLYMLIMPEQVEVPCETSLVDLAMNIPKMIGSLEIENHHRAVKSYVKDCGMTAEVSPAQIQVMDGGQPAITMSFDNLHRLTGLKASLSESSEAADNQDSVFGAADATEESPFGIATDEAGTAEEPGDLALNLNSGDVAEDGAAVGAAAGMAEGDVAQAATGKKGGGLLRILLPIILVVVVIAAIVFGALQFFGG